MNNKLEYIPGDLVMVDNDIVKVMARSVNYFLKIINNYDVMFHSGNVYKYIPNKLKPIPLTPEILEKNGWYGATHIKQSDDNTKILYKTFKRKGYPTIKVSQELKITCELSPFIVKLESVPDLQHLLFGLGLNSEMEV